MLTTVRGDNCWLGCTGAYDVCDSASDINFGDWFAIFMKSFLFCWCRPSVPLRLMSSRWRRISYPLLLEPWEGFYPWCCVFELHCFRGLICKVFPLASSLYYVVILLALIYKTHFCYQKFNLNREGSERKHFPFCVELSYQLSDYKEIGRCFTYWFMETLNEDTSNCFIIQQLCGHRFHPQLWPFDYCFQP